jgi:hypothetical protein
MHSLLPILEEEEDAKLLNIITSNSSNNNNNNSNLASNLLLNASLNNNNNSNNVQIEDSQIPSRLTVKKISLRMSQEAKRKEDVEIRRKK